MAITRNTLLPFPNQFRNGSFAIPALDQAKTMLDRLLSVHHSEGKKRKIAITYSANDQQANDIRKAQCEGKYLEDLKIDGSNQAAVFYGMIHLLQKEPKYKELKGQIHVLPIATSLRGGSDAALSNQTEKYHAVRDLTYIAAHINSPDYICYVITNPDNNRPAIGGGMSQVWGTKEETGKYVLNIIDRFINEGTEFKDEGSIFSFNECDLDLEIRQQRAVKDPQKYLSSRVVSDPKKGSKNKKNTSDHTYQSASVSLVRQSNQVLFTVTGSTWNLMNQCVSKAKNGKYKNNPWDHDETNKEYLDRKELQLSQIINILTKPAKAKKDYMFLQEIDIFTRKIINDASAEKRRLKLLADFKKELKKHGYEIIHTENARNQKWLATIYNNKALEFIPHSQKGVLATQTNLHTGFSLDFHHRATKRKMRLVNLHLDFNQSYDELIPEYQQQNINQGMFTVMGGDTNHAPNTEIIGLLNNWNNVTNLDGVEVNGRIALSIYHVDSNGNLTNRKKCYDGFFANPTKDTYVSILKGAGQVFEVEQGEIVVNELQPDLDHVHRSAVGEAWRRGGFTDAQRNATQTDVFSELAAITNEKQFLKQLDKVLKDEYTTRATIIDLFNRFKDPNGNMTALHSHANPKWDHFRFRVFKKTVNPDEDYWQTKSFQKAINLLKKYYLQKLDDKSIITNADENALADFFRGNAPIHPKKTTTRKKLDQIKKRPR